MGNHRHSLMVVVSVASQSGPLLSGGTKHGLPETRATMHCYKNVAPGVRDTMLASGTACRQKRGGRGEVRAGRQKDDIHDQLG
jgi:hypothetical protein